MNDGQDQKKPNSDQEVAEETSEDSTVEETPAQDKDHIESQDEIAPSTDFNEVEEEKIKQEENQSSAVSPPAGGSSENAESTEDTENPSEEVSESEIEEEATDVEGSKEPEGPEESKVETETVESEEPTEVIEAETTEPVSEEESSNEKSEDTTDAESDQPADPVVEDKGKWYVVHTYSGHENKVATTLRQRIESEHLENKIFDILVPTQDKIEIRGGKKEQVKEKIFPGYILIKMELDDTSWLAVRTTQGVTSFVGIGNKPTPIPAHEVASIVKFMTQGAPATFKDVFLVDDTVKIIDGPFSDFIGKVDSVDKEKGKVRVLVSIFGRETPVELDFLQITKL